MKDTAEPQMLVAIDSFVAKFGDHERAFAQDVTRVRSDDPRLEGIRHLFKPLEATYVDVEAASAAPGEKRGA